MAIPEFDKFVAEEKSTGSISAESTIRKFHETWSKLDHHASWVFSHDVLKNALDFEQNNLIKTINTQLPILSQKRLTDIVGEMEMAKYNWPPYVYKDLATVLTSLHQPNYLLIDCGYGFSHSTDHIGYRPTQFGIKFNEASNVQKRESLLRSCSMCQAECNIYFVIIAKYNLLSLLGSSSDTDINEIVSRTVEQRHHSTHQEMRIGGIMLIVKRTVRIKNVRSKGIERHKRRPNWRTTRKRWLHTKRMNRKNHLQSEQFGVNFTSSELQTDNTQRLNTSAIEHVTRSPIHPQSEQLGLNFTSSESQTDNTQLLNTPAIEHVTQNDQIFQWLNTLPCEDFPTWISAYSFEEDENKTYIFVDDDVTEDYAYKYFKTKAQLTNTKEYTLVPGVTEAHNSSTALRNAYHDKLNPGSRLIAVKYDQMDHPPMLSTIGGFLKDAESNVYAISSCHQMKNFDGFIDLCDKTRKDNEILFSYNSTDFRFFAEYFENGKSKSIELGRRAYGLLGTINEKGVDILAIPIDQETLGSVPHSMHGDGSSIFTGELSDLHLSNVMKRGAVTFDTYGILISKGRINVPVQSNEEKVICRLKNLLSIYHSQLEFWNEKANEFSKCGDSGSFIATSNKLGWHYTTGIAIHYGTTPKRDTKYGLMSAYVSTELANAILEITRVFKINFAQDCLAVSENNIARNCQTDEQTNRTDGRRPRWWTRVGRVVRNTFRRSPQPEIRHGDT